MVIFLGQLRFRFFFQLDEHLNDLVHAQTSYTLSRTGLAEKLAILNKVQTERITVCQWGYVSTGALIRL
jgi:hypothetical protein